jgi:MoaA/NifB/PqqE/SkfB family radical SAM enzyme
MNKGPANTLSVQVPAFLTELPPYKNNALKSLYRRTAFFLYILLCRMRRIERPLHVVLVTNAKCNSSCTYCYGSYGVRDAGREFTTQELIEIIDELWKMGTKNLTVHGGEALLRSDIGLLLNYMKHKGFYVSINTNGILVPQKIDALRCVDSICISLDGTQEHNDRYRGKGSFRVAVEAMKIIVKNRIPLVAHSTLTRASQNDVEYLAQLMRDIGGRLQFSILYNIENLDDRTIILSDSEIRQALHRILDCKRKGYPIYYSERVLETSLRWPFSYDRQYCTTVSDRQQIRCFHGSLKYQIDADGRVVTCWKHNDTDAPNIRDLGLKEALRQCGRRKTCMHCTFLANNEHNALFSLGFKNVLYMMGVQVQDALKIKWARK